MPGTLFSSLARAFLAGEQSADEIVARATEMLGRPWRWLEPLAQRYLKIYAGCTRPRHREVVRFLLRDKNLSRVRRKYFHELSIHQSFTGPQQMAPVAAASGWNLPAIASVGDLASWLGLTVSELDWFADLKGLAYKPPSASRLGHYHYRVLAKDGGSIRLIESPKPRLKQLQRQILSHILNKIPAHESVHGFVRGRSIRSFVAPHVGKRVVLRMDLQDFFPSLSGARIQTVFRTMGYPEGVADLLGGICTNATPRRVWSRSAIVAPPDALWELRALYARPHVPQGASDVAVPRELLRLSGRLPADGIGKGSGRGVHALCGRSGFFRPARL